MSASFAAKAAPQNHTARLLDAASGTVYVLRDTVDMDDFKTNLWLAVLVSKHKTRAFEEKLGHEEIDIAEYGKVLLRSGELITADMVKPLLDNA